MQKTQRSVLPLILLLQLGAPAHAALVAQFDNSGRFPVDLDQTLDTVENLLWLDLSVTAGRTYDEMHAWVKTNPSLGWRFATTEQVATLINHYPGLDPHGYATFATEPADWAAISGFQQLLGFQNTLQGMAAQERGSDFVPVSGIYELRYPLGPTNAYVTSADEQATFARPDDTHALIGIVPLGVQLASWLIKDFDPRATGVPVPPAPPIPPSAVPLPASAWLLLSGLGLLGRRLRRPNK